MVTRHKKMNINEDLFSLGLLHDIGKLILLQAVSNLQRPKKSGMGIEPEALQSIISEYHRPVGAKILTTWGYSKAFAALIQHHRASEEEPLPLAMQALHQADLLAKIAGLGYGRGSANEAADQLEQLGYPLPLRDEFKAQILSRNEQLRYTFG
jgi:HD-like signal output (HDOD) protein